MVVWIASFLGACTPVLSLPGCNGGAHTFDQPRVDVQEVNPYFMVATSVGGLDTKDVTINLKCTVHADVPHASAHSSGTLPGPHCGVWPSGTGTFAVANASSIVLSRL